MHLLTPQNIMIKACIVLAIIAGVHALALASTGVDNALKYASKHTSEYDKDLVQLASIPSISSLPEHAEDVERAAEWLSKRMKDAGLEVRRCPGALVLAFQKHEISFYQLSSQYPWCMHIHMHLHLT